MPRCADRQALIRQCSPSRHGGGYLDQTAVLRLVRKAGIPTPFMRFERGAPVHLVAQTLGHSSIQTTSRYLHARPTDSSSRVLAV
jgi:integrase/recombinase XerD